MTTYPCPPAHIAPYVEVLGVSATIDFLLSFGGAEVYLTTNPKGRSGLAEMIGAEKAVALAEVIPKMKVRVPIPKPWIARCLKSEGLSVASIARRLHVADNTVRRWLDGGDGDGAAAPAKDSRQLDLF